MVCYISVQLKPITILAQDVIAHTFYKAYHIATEHHHHGHHHVHEQIAEDEDHEHQNTSSHQSSQKLNEEIFTHIITDFGFVFSNRSIDTKHHSILNQSISSVYLEIKNPPPQILI